MIRIYKSKSLEIDIILLTTVNITNELLIGIKEQRPTTKLKFISSILHLCLSPAIGCNNKLKLDHITRFEILVFSLW